MTVGPWDLKNDASPVCYSFVPVEAIVCVSTEYSAPFSDWFQAKCQRSFLGPSEESEQAGEMEIHARHLLC